MQTTNDELPLMTGTAVAQLLGCSIDTVLRLANAGALPCLRDSANRRLYKRSDVVALAKERAAKR